MNPKNLFDKIWDAHVIRQDEDGTTLIHIDRHLVHEVTSPQAFEGLRLAGRGVRHPELTFAVPDHNVPTTNLEQGITDPIARLQVETLDQNCNTHRITQFGMGDIRQGVVHVMAPEQGIILPGLTVVCGDSHTATHGAFGTLAFGIGTSEVEHVLATQTLPQKKSKSMLIRVNGSLHESVSAKDVILHIIGEIGTAGGTGHVMEFSGSVIENLSMEGRMTVCNMAIEGGARAGMVAVDDKTIAYLQGRPLAPKGETWDKAVAFWRTLRSDPGAHYDTVLEFDAANIAPQVSWGTSPEMTVPVNAKVPNPEQTTDPVLRGSMEKALTYMGLQANTAIEDINIDTVFIGSCTNGRIEDLRAAANMIQGKQVAKTVQLAIVVPGTGLVKQQAETEGLHTLFLEAGFEWRAPGCSMCLAMNADALSAGDRCASTSNRNFEGRQGAGGRTHLVSPAMAAAAAVAGHFVDIRNWS